MKKLKFKVIGTFICLIMIIALIVEIDFKDIVFWILLFVISFSSAQTINYFTGKEIGLLGPAGAIKKDADYAERFMGLLGSLLVGLFCLYILLTDVLGLW